MKIRRLLGRTLSVVLTVAMLAGNTSIAALADTPEDAANVEATSQEDISSEESSVSETDSLTESETETDETGVEDTVEEETAGSEEPTEGLSDEEGSLIEETETEAVTEKETDPESAEKKSDLPYGLKGMPEGYKLSPEQKEDKYELRTHNVLDSLRALTPGVDYVEDEILFWAENREEAELIADAYNAVLIDYSYNLGVAKLPDDLTVLEAVEVGMSDQYPIPFVEANCSVELEEPVEDTADEDIDMLGSGDFEMPHADSYIDWVRGRDGEAPILDNVDPYLMNTFDNDAYQWQHEMINSYEAWTATTGSSDVLVAVIDTGVDKDHEDLGGRVRQVQVNTISMEPQINYSTGKKQDHGTHCAGIIAASLNNGKGGAGIAPDVNILSLNIFGESNRYNNYDLGPAIGIAIEQGADIISMSLGSFVYSVDIQKKINEAYNAGITVIASAGNENCDGKDYPGAFNHVISVASVNRDGTRSEFSNYGSWVDLAAPGSHIMSTIPDNGYDLMSGTSMAAPVVSGVAALYMSKFGNPGPAAMEKILKASTNKAASGKMGKGIINAGKMFASVKAVPIIKAYDSLDTEIKKPSSGVEEGAYVKIERDALEDPTPGDDYIIYTTDGKNPVVKNGEIVCGEVYKGKIMLDAFPSATVITVKALIVSEVGTVGKIASLKVKTFDKTVKAVLTAKTVKLDKTKLGLEYRDTSDPGNNKGTISITTLTDSSGVPIDPISCKHEWVTSNARVATVEETSPGVATVTSTGKGTAKITLKLLDGSKKTAICTVTVARLVDNIHVTGQTMIAPGSSAVYKAVVVPSNANNKKVTWDVYEKDPPYSRVEGVSISASGKLTVGRNVAQGTILTVSASPKDGSDVDDGYIWVTVGAKADKLEIKTDKDTINNPISQFTYDKKSNRLKTAQIYSLDHPDMPQKENEIAFKAVVNDGIGESAWAGALNWSINNTDILDFSDGVSRGSQVKVKGIKAGTAKLTCSLMDGSGKKMTISVKVINPASGIDLLPNDKDCYYLAVGKSTTARAGLGRAYGIPTVTAVDYSFKAYEGCVIDLDTTELDLRDEENYSMLGYYVKGHKGGTNEITDILKTYGAVSLNKGKLSVNKKKWNAALDSISVPRDSVIRIAITGTTTDGTGYSDTMTVFVQPAVSRFRTEYPGYWGTASISCDYYNVIWSDTYHGPLECKSNNNKKMRATYGGCYWVPDYGKYCYYMNECFLYTGRSTATATATDGSGKKISIKWILYPW